MIVFAQLQALRERLPELLSFFASLRTFATDDSAPTASKRKPATRYLITSVRGSAGAQGSRGAPRKVVLHMPTGAARAHAMHIVASHLIVNEPTVVCWLAQNASCWIKRPTNLIMRGALWATGQSISFAIGPPQSRHPGSEGWVCRRGLAKMAALDKREPAKLLRFSD